MSNRPDFEHGLPTQLPAKEAETRRSRVSAAAKGFLTSAVITAVALLGMRAAAAAAHTTSHSLGPAAYPQSGANCGWSNSHFQVSGSPFGFPRAKSFEDPWSDCTWVKVQLHYDTTVGTTGTTSWVTDGFSASVDGPTAAEQIESYHQVSGGGAGASGVVTLK